jgi:hypothetical protein
VVKIKPGTKGHSDTVIITDTVATKLPKPDRDESLFFVDGSGNLTRQNPTQPSLPLRPVERPDAEDDTPATNMNEV